MIKDQEEKAAIVMRAVAQYFKVEPEFLRTKKRHEQAVTVKYFCAYLLDTLLAMKQSDIAPLLNLERSTVSFALSRVKDALFGTNPVGSAYQVQVWREARVKCAVPLLQQESVDMLDFIETLRRTASDLQKLADICAKIDVRKLS